MDLVLLTQFPMGIHQGSSQRIASNSRGRAVSHKRDFHTGLQTTGLGKVNRVLRKDERVRCSARVSAELGCIVSGIRRGWLDSQEVRLQALPGMR